MEEVEADKNREVCFANQTEQVLISSVQTQKKIFPLEILKWYKNTLAFWGHGKDLHWRQYLVLWFELQIRF